MFKHFAILSLGLLCGCATGSRVAVGSYNWTPEHFQFFFPSGGWRQVNRLTSNGEDHIMYERRCLFRASHREQVAISSYVPTRSGSQPGYPEDVFRNVTNWLAQSYALRVKIVERTDNSITWEWSGVQRGSLPSASGIEKIVRGEMGLYRLQYGHRSVPLSPKQEQIWLPIIKNARLVREAASYKGSGVER
jgi:hypothetical protein